MKLRLEVSNEEMTLYWQGEICKFNWSYDFDDFVLFYVMNARKVIEKRILNSYLVEMSFTTGVR